MLAGADAGFSSSGGILSGVTEAPLSFKEKELLKVVVKKVQGTDIEILLKESGLIK